MARPCVCHSFCWNSFPASKDELTGAASGASTNDIGTFTYIPAVSCAPILAVAIASAIALSSDNKLFKQFIKAYLKA